MFLYSGRGVIFHYHVDAVLEVLGVEVQFVKF